VLNKKLLFFKSTKFWLKHSILELLNFSLRKKSYFVISREIFKNVKTRNGELELRNGELELRNGELELRNGELEKFRNANTREIIKKLILSNCEDKYDRFLIDAIRSSQSQLSQDLLVLAVLEFLESGFYVEIGACDGLSFSNTYILEKLNRWDGLVVEPAKIWHSKLREFRNCKIDERAVVGRGSGFTQFSETSDPMYSTFSSLSFNDLHASLRVAAKSYPVQVVGIMELFEFNSVPKKINYLSIDTEGSEYDILSALDFNSYQIDFISVEHNFTENALRIDDLLSRHGFIRILKQLSIFDGWYVNSRIDNEFTQFLISLD